MKSLCTNVRSLELVCISGRRVMARTSSTMEAPMQASSTPPPADPVAPKRRILIRTRVYTNPWTEKTIVRLREATELNSDGINNVLAQQADKMFDFFRR